MLKHVKTIMGNWIPVESLPLHLIPCKQMCLFLLSLFKKDPTKALSLAPLFFFLLFLVGGEHCTKPLD